MLIVGKLMCWPNFARSRLIVSINLSCLVRDRLLDEGKQLEVAVSMLSWSGQETQQTLDGRTLIISSVGQGMAAWQQIAHRQAKVAAL